MGEGVWASIIARVTETEQLNVNELVSRMGSILYYRYDSIDGHLVGVQLEGASQDLVGQIDRHENLAIAGNWLVISLDRRKLADVDRRSTPSQTTASKNEGMTALAFRIDAVPSLSLEGTGRVEGNLFRVALRTRRGDN